MSQNLLTDIIMLLSLFWKLNLEVGNCMSCSKVLFIKMIQLKVLKILSKAPFTKENKCQMLTQAINFCKFIFFWGSDYPQKICHILNRWKDDSFATGYIYDKCLDRKFRNKAACQRSHSNERHINPPSP